MSWTRHLKLPWILALLVLVGSLLGANHIMNTPRHPGEAAKGDSGDRPVRGSGQRSASGFAAIGVFAPENDMVRLVPSVKGEVTEVLVKNDQRVKMGQVLLRMDNRAASNDYARAENAVKGAEKLLQKAKDGVREWEVKRALQVTQIQIRETQYGEAWETMNKLKGPAQEKLSAKAEIEYKIATFKAEEAALAVQAEKKALELVDLKKPSTEIEQAEVGVVEAKLLRDKAKLGLDYCDLKAPADGTIMQVTTSVGAKFGDQGVQPAFLFFSGPVVVKAEINQEWANQVKLGMTAVVHDHSGNGQQWKGRVTYVAGTFLPPRRDAGALPGLMEQAQEAVLECRITLDPDQPKPFLNQKVRVHLGQ